MKTFDENNHLVQTETIKYNYTNGTPSSRNIEIKDNNGNLIKTEEELWSVSEERYYNKYKEPSLFEYETTGKRTDGSNS